MVEDCGTEGCKRPFGVLRGAGGVCPRQHLRRITSGNKRRRPPPPRMANGDTTPQAGAAKHTWNRPAPEVTRALGPESASSPKQPKPPDNPKTTDKA